MYWLVVIALIIIVLKCVAIFTKGTSNNYTCLVGKTAIITGANVGIGYTTALEMAKRGARVILACIDPDLAEKARESIIKETGNSSIIFRQLDLASLASVKQFAKVINETENGIHLLINNAGAVGLPHKITEDNFQLMLQTNYLGSVLLTVLLLEKIKNSGHARIINIFSVAAATAFWDLNNINSTPAFDPFRLHLYGKTKLYNILFTIALAKRLEGTKVTVNALHPGVINTNLFLNFPKYMQILWVMGNFLWKDPVEGAQTTIHLATAKELENKTGCYFVDCKERRHYWNINDRLVEDVWNQTKDILGLKI